MFAPITKHSFYKSSDFLGFLINLFKIMPCPLCGTVHDFHNHGKITRLVRSSQTYENMKISIFVLFCAASKEAGKQYTKRMLPPFVIPECNITLENSLQMIKQFPKKPINYNKACELLGTCCDKTVKRHYRLITEMIQITTNSLMTWIAAHPMLSAMPVTKPSIPDYMFFISTYEALCKSQEKISGYSEEPPEEIHFPSFVLMLNKVRKPIPIPLNLTCLIRFLFDTS